MTASEPDRMTASAWAARLAAEIPDGTYPTVPQIMRQYTASLQPVILHYSFANPATIVDVPLHRLDTQALAVSILMRRIVDTHTISKAVKLCTVERLANDDPSVPTPEDQDVKQAVTKLAVNGRTAMGDIMDRTRVVWWVDERILPMRSLASLKAGPDLWWPFKFSGIVIGLEPQRAVPRAYYTHEHSREQYDGAPLAAHLYNPKAHGTIIETVYEDVQWYLVEEAGTAAQSSMSSPRRLPMRSHDPHVNAYDIGTPVEAIALYCVGDAGSASAGATPKKKQAAPDELDYWLDCVQARRTNAAAPPTLTPAAAASLDKGARDGTILDDLVASFAPHITGNRTAKLLCLICAAGGSPIGDYRAEIHGYLVGNPGTGKSEMIKAAARLRGPTEACYADAANASSRGLLYGQEDFQRHRILKAGLFVRHSLVCLDELPNMSPAQVHDVNTTLEQQVVSYHKAGFDRDTPVSVSLLAAGNPHDQQWDPNKTVMDNLAPVPAPLISRMIITRVDHTVDVAARLRHVVATIGGGTDIQAPYSEDDLASYMHHIRRNISPPTLSKEASAVLERFIVRQTALTQGRDDTLPMETRQHIDLIRVALAIARLHAAPAATADHMRMAVSFFSSCLSSMGVQTVPLDDKPGQPAPPPPPPMPAPVPAGRKLNRHDAFWQVFDRILAAEKTGMVDHSALKWGMMHSDSNHWRLHTLEADDYIAKMVEGGKIFEARPYAYKKVE